MFCHLRRRRPVGNLPPLSLLGHVVVDQLLLVPLHQLQLLPALLLLLLRQLVHLLLLQLLLFLRLLCSHLLQGFE